MLGGQESNTAQTPFSACVGRFQGQELY